MFESLRKMMLFGLGAADLAVDKMGETIDDLVSRGELSVEEGRKLFDEFTARAQDQQRNVNQRIKEEIRNQLRELGVAERTQVAMLEAKIEALQNRIEILEENLPKRETIEG